MYYRNVYLFVEKILNLIIIKEHDLMKTNLNICFRDNIFIEYIVEFIILKRFDFNRLIKSKIESIRLKSVLSLINRLL